MNYTQRAHDIAVAVLPIIYEERKAGAIRKAKASNDSEVHIHIDIYEIYKELFTTPQGSCFGDYCEDEGI